MTRKNMSKTPRTARRRATFILEDAPGKKVFVAGCFNDWQPTKELVDKDGNGEYSCVMFLEPGTYQYKFVVDGEWRLDERNPNFSGNEFGTLNSVLVLEEK